MVVACLPDAGDQVSGAEGSPVLSPSRSHGFLEIEEYNRPLASLVDRGSESGHSLART